MTRINTNLSSIVGQNVLGRNQASLQTALTRLSTGLRINSGKDDPSGLIASEVLGAELTSISASIKNSQRANNIVSTADSALAQVNSLLNDIRGLIQSSANKGAISGAEIAANQVQVDSAIQSISRIGQTTVFGGTQLLNGSKAFNVSGNVGTVFGSTADITFNSFDPSAARTGAGNDVTVALTQGATHKSIQVVGDSQVAGGATSLRNLSIGQSTRTVSTVSATQLASISTDSTAATRTITAASVDGLNTGNTGTADGTITLQLSGVVNGANVNATLTPIAASTLASTGGNSYAGSIALRDAINLQSANTGVSASVNTGTGLLTLSSTTYGAGVNINLTATAATGTRSINTIPANVGADSLDDIVADTGTTLTFDVVRGANTDTITIANLDSLTNAGVTAADRATYLAGLITANATTTGVTAAAVGAVITLTAPTVGTTAITVGNVGGTTIAGNQTILTNILGGATGSNGVAAATVTAAVTAGVTAQVNGTDSTNSTKLTVTGDKGAATIDLAALRVVGTNDTSTGNDVLKNYVAATDDSGIQALADLINTRTGTTGVTASLDASNNLLLTSSGVGSNAVATIAYDSGNTAATAADDTLLGSVATVSTVAGVDGTSNQTTYKITGDLGAATITVNNNDVINDSQTLVDAINRVTNQTGVTATTDGGNLADITLNSLNFGANAVLSFAAVSGTDSADVDLINDTDTLVETAGKDVQGSVATGKGTGSFTGIGSLINYNDSAINFTAQTAASVTNPTRATTTIVGTSGGVGGLSNLTGTGSDTITFQLSGSVAGSATTTSITVNAAALKADSRVLVEAINKSSLTSGVRASVDPDAVSFDGADIILESTTEGSQGQVSITATAATQAADVTVFNDDSSQTGAAPGLNTPASASASFDVSGGALFQIGPTVNFANQVNINITAIDVALLGRNVNSTGNKALSALLTGGTDTLDKFDLGDAAKLVEQAISEISTLRGRLGALQKNVFESNINSLQASFEQVTSAQSQIRDADFAVETANLTRAQILVQAGTSVLAIANSSPQQVLSLLQR